MVTVMEHCVMKHCVMPVLAQEQWTDVQSLGQNWDYRILAGITPIMKLKNQQPQIAVMSSRLL
jgi:hypothetical protein